MTKRVIAVLTGLAVLTGVAAAPASAAARPQHSYNCRIHVTMSGKIWATGCAWYRPGHHGAPLAGLFGW